MATLTHARSQLRRRLFKTLLLTRLGSTLGAWLFVLGSGLLIARVMGHETVALAIPLLMLPLLLGLCWLAARRAIPPEAALTALLDAHNDAGGLLMAGSAVDTSAWPALQVNLPRIHTNLTRRQLFLPWLGLLYTLACLLLPLQTPDDPATTLSIEREIARLEEQITLLEELGLDEASTREVHEQLESLRGSENRDPRDTWEALDHLALSLAREGSELANEVARSAQEASALEQMVDQLLQNQTATNLDQALKEMRQLLQNLESGPNQELYQELIEQLGQGGEALKDMAQRLAKQNQDLEKLAQQLAANRMIDPKALERLARKMRQQSAQSEMRQMLKDMQESEGSCANLAQLCAGIGRGRGDAPMTWMQEADKDGAQFEDLALPPGEELAGQPHLVGLGSAAPSEEYSTSQGKALSGAKAGPGGAHTQTLLPKHRKAVRTYFAK